MADQYIQQITNSSKTTKNVENEIKNSIQNINIDLSNLDMSGAIESFQKLEEAVKASNFDSFIVKIVTLQESFVAFQKAVQTANTSVTNFAKSSDKITGGNTAIVTNVEINTGDIGAQIGDISASASASVGSMSSSISASASAIGSSFSAMGAGALDFGNGIATALGSITGLVDSVANLFVSFQSLGEGLVLAGTGIAALIPLLPALGTSILQMAVNMAGIMEYIPQLIVFMLILAGLALLGEGLMMAGTGLLNIGLGLTAMTEGMAALLAFMPLFIESLSGITANVGGIILFVLLAVAMLAMAVAMQMMNEQMAQFVANMTTLAGLMSVGFVAALVVFGLTLIAMSLFMNKVASGIDKIKQSIQKQIAQLAILNPLLAAQAILSNPIMGVITVALAVAGGLLVKALLPGMATGGVVSSPMIAMVGEGRYPEAVVSLGDSPQFARMKADIANAVIQGLSAMNRGGGNSSAGEIVLNVDGEKLARVLIPQIRDEQKRCGLSPIISEV